MKSHGTAQRNFVRNPLHVERFVAAMGNWERASVMVRLSARGLLAQAAPARPAADADAPPAADAAAPSSEPGAWERDAWGRGEWQPGWWKDWAWKGGWEATVGISLRLGLMVWPFADSSGANLVELIRNRLRWFICRQYRLLAGSSGSNMDHSNRTWPDACDKSGQLGSARIQRHQIELLESVKCQETDNYRWGLIFKAGWQPRS